MSTRSSLRSPSPRRPAPSPSLPSPLEAILGCFFTRGVNELPVPELVTAYLFQQELLEKVLVRIAHLGLCALMMASEARLRLARARMAVVDDEHRPSVEEAWKALRYLEQRGVLELLPVPARQVDLWERRFCPKRGRAFLATARLGLPVNEARSLAAVAAAPLLHLPSLSPEERATAQRLPDVSTGPLHPVAPSGGCSAAANVTEDERDFCPIGWAA
jgi:hypothetical protein